MLYSLYGFAKYSKCNLCKAKESWCITCAGQLDYIPAKQVRNYCQVIGSGFYCNQVVIFCFADVYGSFQVKLSWISVCSISDLPQDLAIHEFHFVTIVMITIHYDYQIRVGPCPNIFVELSFACMAQRLDHDNISIRLPRIRIVNIL